jgi:DNA-binding transcriptional ArsR family regulator
MSHYDLEVAWHPGFELLVSLLAYTSAALHRVVDLGAPWRQKVRRALPAELEERLQTLSRANRLEAVLAFGLTAAHAYTSRIPDPKPSVVSFIDWLAGLSAGDLYSLAAGYAPEGGSVPADLEALRDEAAVILPKWNTHYFSAVDPAILAGLAADAEAKCQMVATMPAAGVVEEVSGGVVVMPEDPIERLVLVPQHHARPWNLYRTVDDPVGRIVLHCYPADASPPSPGEPPSRLVRLTRALDDPNRLRILRHVAAGPRTFTEIADQMHLTKPTVHYHLVLLRAAGLLRVETYLSKTYGSRYTLRRAALSALASELDAYLSPGGQDK